jgi:hypothetical protein
VEPGLDERFASAEAALQKLHSSTQQPIYVERPAVDVAPVAIAKPNGSSVNLSTSTNLLTIQFPKKAIKRTHTTLPLFKISPVWLAAAFVIAFVNPALSILLLLIWRIAPYLEQSIVRIFQRPLTQSNILRIDQHQIVLELYESDKLKTSISSSRQTINRLEYRISDEGYHSLKIWADKEYELGRNELLSYEELKWLAYELGKWLNLPIHQTRQHIPLPTALYRKGLSQTIQLKTPLKKPTNSKVVLLKRPSWIDILIPIG